MRTDAVESYDLRPELATQITHFWGHDYEVTPALVDKVFGDGRQVIFFTPLASRPNWYVVRVDSSWSEDNWNSSATDYVYDHTDEIYDAIDHQYGNAHYEDEPEDSEGEDFPSLHDGYGVGWGMIFMLEPGQECILPESTRVCV